MEKDRKNLDWTIISLFSLIVITIGTVIGSNMIVNESTYDRNDYPATYEGNDGPSFYEGTHPKYKNPTTRKTKRTLEDKIGESMEEYLDQNPDLIEDYLNR